MNKKKKHWVMALTLAVLAVAVAAVPFLQAVNEKQFTDPVEKRAELKAEMEALRAEIDASGYTFTVGFNPAMRYSLEELCQLNTNLPLPTGHLSEGLDRSGDQPSRTADLPAAYTGYFTPVRNQGSCGLTALTCTGIFEAAIFMTDGVWVNLSEQQLISCNPWGWGCNTGGYWFNEMMVNPGAMLESCFPFVGLDIPCETSCPIVYQASAWGFVTQDGEVPPVEGIKTAIYNYGSVQAAVYVDTAFMAYTSGVFNQTTTDGLVKS
ncbi:MAG: hypothetical protein KAW12_18880, partial [Candidatus Aminicenantes bacterium]|nr:hypothetical protein [Candidatus Aminicenantes bacterium]